MNGTSTRGIEVLAQGQAGLIFGNGKPMIERATDDVGVG